MANGGVQTKHSRRGRWRWLEQAGRIPQLGILASCLFRETPKGPTRPDPCCLLFSRLDLQGYDTPSPGQTRSTKVNCCQHESMGSYTQTECSERCYLTLTRLE
ncbi:hypothetical protein L1987_23484 [Smallanthus sonchifolius]|uniref:Uncharacterized protein n=1 Tax=Smallanthus sonchifolius TaxID=185202 RepID=A0ACB9IHT0_9ASTR|nr:hypothetical protein L1987_23484 [Smallanthus sonchifolius]